MGVIYIYFNIVRIYAHTREGKGENIGAEKNVHKISALSRRVIWQDVYCRQHL